MPATLFVRYTGRRILRLAPELLPIFDFLHGSNAIGSCVYYGGGGSQPKGSCLVPGGVQQGDGLCSIFFGFGADGMITGVELELELIISQMAQKPVLRGEVGVRV